MKKIAIALLSLALVAPSMDARGRNNTGNNQRPATTSQQAAGRPGQAKPGNNNSSRPGNGGGNQGGNPGWNNPAHGNGNGNGNQGGNPGWNNPGHGGGNQGGNPGWNNPGHGGGNHGGGPGNNFGPGAGGGPNFGHGPGGPAPGNHAQGPAFGVPYRPYMPVSRPWSRPMPPAQYRPVGNPFFSTILGLAIGTTINFALNDLVNAGYAVTGYGNNAIYINNVNQLNLLWPNATLYYTNGLLQGSEYVYSTSYYDTYRYNLAYNRLVANYGMPYSTQMLPGGGMQATWWGPNGQYITLNFSAASAYNGSSRFYTTLSIGQ